MRPFAAGVWSGFILACCSMAACATTWKYYGELLSDRVLTPDDVGKKLSDLCYDEGKLLGKQGSDGWPDLPLDECKPDQAIAGKCVVQTTDVYRALEKDDEDCHIQLSDCEKGKP